MTGRGEEQVTLVEAYAKAQGLWHDAKAEPRYSEQIELDLSTVVPSIAGPKRPQDRVSLSDAKTGFREALGAYVDDAPNDGVHSTVDEGSAESFPASDAPAVGSGNGAEGAPHGRPAEVSGRPSRCPSAPRRGAAPSSRCTSCSRSRRGGSRAPRW